MIRGLDALFTHSVTLTPQTGINQYGESTFTGTASTHRARVIWKPALVRAPNGAEITTNAKVIFYGVSGVKPRDTITLPDGRVVTVEAIEKHSDEVADVYDAAFCT